MRHTPVVLIAVLLALAAAPATACNLDYTCYWVNPTYQNCVWQANFVHSGCRSACPGQAQQFCSSIKDFDQRMSCQAGYQVVCENQCDEAHCGDISACYDSSNCFYYFASLLTPRTCQT